MKLNSIIFIILVTLPGCKNSNSNFHNGTYIFSDSTVRYATKESIIIEGNSATLHLRSLFNKSKLKKSKYICIQHPNSIDLPLSKQPPITIPVDKDGNLVWGDKLFKKQPIPIILSTPIPEAFLESGE